ncbi:MAG: capsular biosynthesis protein [Cyanobacteria bacterium QH_9_48_43]|nr:MAG: capsular biosynthesis protein [Cyanobacteria bacterium QH_9_48_43]
MNPQNLPETLIWYYIIGTYGIYILGAQFFFAILLACFLTFYLLIKWWNQTEETPPEDKITFSSSSWVWLAAMLVLAVALVIAHLNFDYGLVQIVKSSLKWIPFALFPLVGHLNIRPQLIYRAVCILCLQSLILIPILYLASILNIPGHLYTSPLAALGGTSSRHEVILYAIENSGRTRLHLFASHSVGLGIVGNIYFFLAQQELDQKWRCLGIAGAVAMILSSVSRAAILCLPFVIVSVWLLTNFFRPWVQFAAGLASFLTGIFSATLINALETFREQFHELRAGSSEVRAIVLRMTVRRWQNEAPIWGHGVIEEQGPAVAAYMPLGTHHTWYSILYTQGLVGCIALAVAFGWSLIDLLFKAQTSKQAKVGLSILLVLFLFTFSEIIHDSAYIYWPGLVILGNAFRDKV